MRARFTALLLLALPSLLCATLPGDSLEAVLKEKGAPVNKLEHGNVKVLYYPDVEIRLEDGIVASVTPLTDTPPPKTGSQPLPPKPKAKVR